MNDLTPKESHDKIPWIVTFVLFFIFEGIAWAILAAFDATNAAKVLLLAAFAFWVTFCVFAPKSYLESPFVAESIGVKRAWVARVVCAIAALFLWWLAIYNWSPALANRIFLFI